MICGLLHMLTVADVWAAIRKYDYIYICTLTYALVLPGRNTVFRAEFWPDSKKESFTIGRRADVDEFPTRTQAKSGPEARSLARKHKCVT